jgi:hypothetical protein
MKKIHITESQLKYIKKRLSEAYSVDMTKEVEAANGNAKTAWDRMTAKNPTLKQQAQQGEIDGVFNPEGIDENVNEWEKDVDRDSNEYYQVKDYLESLVGTPQYFSLMGGINGTNMDTSMAIDNIQDYFGYQINRDVIFAALKDFRDEKNRAMIDNDDEYSDVMEKKIITKKQIKEAKLRNLRENCIRITKKNLK